MGYYAKDGSYVRDDSDIKFAEVMNESQGQQFERKQRIIAQAEAYEAKEKRNREANRALMAEIEAEALHAESERARKNMQELNQRIEQERKEKNRRQYGVDYSLRNPKDLSERRARANFWRLNNNFKLLVDTVVGKNQKFGKLWDQYSKAQTDEERLKIVEKMEKMYPTHELAIRNVERKTGYRK